MPKAIQVHLPWQQQSFVKVWLNQRTWIPPLSSADQPKGPFFEDNVNSGIYPYNPYRHPFSRLKRPPTWILSSSPLVSNGSSSPRSCPQVSMPTRSSMNVRGSSSLTRLQQHIRELEAIPTTIGDGMFDPNVDVSENDSKADKENANASAYSALIHPSPTSHGKLRAVIEFKSLCLLDK